MRANKVSKYFTYAIGEIVLVVIGILIALQINNWNENRKNKIKERNIISEIHQEFINNKKQLAFIKSMHQYHLDQVNKVVNLFPIDVTKTNLDSLSSFMLESFADWTFEPTQGRIKWLVNSTNFDLIQNEELRDAFLLWEPTFEYYHEDEQHAIEFNRQSLYPYMRKHFSRGINFEDDRMDLSVLESIEFEQMMHTRRARLRAILENHTNELQRLEAIIEIIIDLTKRND
ncbi:DUF6090 family protein [Portibacter marinus]|uniref:DUF6090 family protein n=1 Tax=Portibacter marinus TaxID=2898660 RepID=UPI001F279AAA|nr:DUF6090 family protein [Portibacter marinus]